MSMEQQSDQSGPDRTLGQSSAAHNRNTVGTAASTLTGLGFGGCGDGGGGGGCMVSGVACAAVPTAWERRNKLPLTNVAPEQKQKCDTLRAVSGTSSSQHDHEHFTVLKPRSL